MDKTAYLQQIASKKSNSSNSSIKSFLFSPKLLFPLLGAIILFIALLVIGNIISSSKPNTPTVLNVSLRAKNLSKTFDSFTRQLKSSELRSSTASLISVLNETESSLAVKTPSTNSKDKSAKNPVTEEAAHQAALKKTLDDAALSGLLERVFLREVNREISLFIDLTSKVFTKTKNSNHATILTTTLNNLHNLQKDFESLRSKIH